MSRSGWLYVLALALVALLTAISGIVSDFAAAQLPAWRPWVWPVFCLLGDTSGTGCGCTCR